MSGESWESGDDVEMGSTDFERLVPAVPLGEAGDQSEGGTAKRWKSFAAFLGKADESRRMALRMCTGIKVVSLEMVLGVETLAGMWKRETTCVGCFNSENGVFSGMKLLSSGSGGWTTWCTTQRRATASKEKQLILL